MLVLVIEVIPLLPGNRRLAVSAGLVVALAAAQLLCLAPSAGASQPSTTGSPTTSSVASTTTTTISPTDCADAFAGPPKGSLNKAIIGGDEIAGFNTVQIKTPRPAGTYHVVDCFKTTQITPVEIGDIRVSGSATFRANIPTSAMPGDDTCDRVVMSGIVDGQPFTDVSNEVCVIYSSCLFSPECPQNQPPPTRGVPSTTGGRLPFTGVAVWPPLITAAALLGLGLTSLLVARRRHE